MLRRPRKALKAQSKTGKCSGFSPLRATAPFSSTSSMVVEFVHVGDNRVDPLLLVPETAQALGDGAVDDLEHAAAGQNLVFDQGDVRLDAGGVAIHQKRDRAGGGENRHLGVLR